MFYKDCITNIGGLDAFGYENGQYPIQVCLPSDLPEAMAKIGKCDPEDVVVDAPASAQEAVLKTLWAAWEQNGKQGGKELIRKAMASGDQAEVDKEVAAHQARAPKYVMGAPRGSIGGVTKTKAGNVGKAFLDKMGPEALLALAKEHGIDPDDLS